MDAVIQLSGVSKRYGTLQALSEVSLRVDEGEVVALLGPNGAGKTTTLSLMLGLRQPSTGVVRVFGLDPRDSQARLQRGAMIQESGMPPGLTVREMVDLFRSYYAHPLPVGTLLGLAGLEDRAGMRVGTLSTGQRQRLQFALAMCGDPRLLILDEPTVGLDVDARRRLWTTVRAFAERGRTVILATHYLDEADELANRALVIDRGRVIADATPALLKAQLPGKRLTFRLGEERLELLSHEPEQILRCLFAHGMPVEDLEIHGARLEEALLSLTRPELAHA